MWGKLSYLAFQVDPYDYDTILFILNLVKELSQETASTVDKVWNQLVVASGQLLSLCWYDFCTLWFKHAASRLNRVELSKDVVGHNDVILRRFWGLRHLLQSWKTRTYGIVVEISFFLVNLPWKTSLVFFPLTGYSVIGLPVSIWAKSSANQLWEIVLFFITEYWQWKGEGPKWNFKTLVFNLDIFNFIVSWTNIKTWYETIWRVWMAPIWVHSVRLNKKKKRISLKWTFAVVVQDSEFISLKTLA